MKEFFGSIYFKILAALSAVILGIVIYSVTTDGQSDAGKALFDRISEPVRSLSQDISDNVTRSLDMLTNAEEYYNENEQLRSEINLLRSQLTDYERMKEENELLRTQLDITEENDDIRFSQSCKVIGRTVNDPFASFTIDRGGEDGISPKNPVMTNEGLVGVCSEVSEDSAKVLSLYSPKVSVSVRTVDGSVTGITVGGYDLASEGYIKMAFIELDADIREGDTIVTAGSEYYPADILVGTVENVRTEESGLSRYALIKPAVDPQKVSTVFAVLDFFWEEDILPTESKGVTDEAAAAETDSDETADDDNEYDEDEDTDEEDINEDDEE